MSLNWKEIDLCLAELDAEGAYVQGVVQPSYDTVVLELYKPGRPFRLFAATAPGACRIHASGRGFRKPERPLRMQELLKSRVIGFRIASMAQVGKERVVKATLVDAERRLFLYFKLWSNAANVILTEADGTIVDAASRRPKRGEMPGGHYDPERDLAEKTNERPEREFSVRELPGEGPFSKRVEEWYSVHEGTLALEALRERAKTHFDARLARVETAIAALKAKRDEYREAGGLVERGDILMANLHRKIEGQWIEAEDFYRDNAPISIRIDPAKSLRENAEDYYQRAKKAKSGLADVEAELADRERALAEVGKAREAALAMTDPIALLSSLRKYAQARRERAGGDGKKIPGVEFESSGWRILVGRTATENDELLRRHVRGNDTWLHTRDVPGGYVFIKAKAGKSIPLEVLLDAGTLAVFYSKARNSGEADLYYTQAKHLRRAKDGPKGLVLPTHEKNLRVRIDQERIRRLKPDKE